jgi:SAM-dependent methyltransferase
MTEAIVNYEKHWYWPEQKRLVLLRRAADSVYWDDHWKNPDVSKKLTRSRRSRYWKRIFTKYFVPNSRIIEGGCGDGHLVDALNYWGYEATGVDFAEETVKRLNETAPHLDIRLGDVRRLGFADGTFDGYISGGVIEHFWEGYNQILTEIHRVLKPKGILVITFPAISLGDRVKIFCRGYERRTFGDKPDSFYQFILPIGRVKKDITEMGFRCTSIMRTGGVGGLKRVIQSFGEVHSFLYYRGQ